MDWLSKFFGWLLALFFVFGGISHLVQSLWISENQEIATAEVIEVTANNRTVNPVGYLFLSYKSTSFDAEYEFQDSSGTKWRWKINAWKIKEHNKSITNADYKVWDTLEVIYDRENPESNTAWWMLRSYLWVVAMVVIGITIFIWSRRTN